MLNNIYSKKLNFWFNIFIVLLLLLISFNNVLSNPLPPKTVYGTSSRTDGESTFDAQVVGTAFGYPNEYTNVEDWPDGGWYFDVGGDTGTVWPDGTPFSVTITMTGWIGSKSSIVMNPVTNVGHITLYPTGAPLNVDVGGVYNGLVGQEITFSGSASGGAIPYTWFWDFGDGNWSNEQNPTNIYSESGTYIVTLIVTDVASQTDSDSTNAVIISGETPTAYANGPYQGMIGEEIQFNGDVIGGTSPYLWLWDFGDGETSNHRDPIHIYDEIGDYIVRLTVIDDLGFSDTDNTSCIVSIYNNHPLKPNTPEGENEGKIGEEYTFYTVTSDPDEDQLWYKWDWGDELSIWVGPYNSVEIVTMLHIWNEQGDYEIKVKARDIHGDESIWSVPLSITMPKQSTQQMNTPDINLTVLTEKDSYKWITEPIEITMEITNNDEDRIALLRFPTTQLYDILIEKSNGMNIYQWSEGKFFNQVITEILIMPGETARWYFSWNQRGHYFRFMPLHIILPGIYKMKVILPTIDEEYQSETSIEIKLL